MATVFFGSKFMAAIPSNPRNLYRRTPMEVTAVPTFKTCRKCNKAFNAARKWQEFCTRKCKDDWHIERRKLADAILNLIEEHMTCRTK